MKIQFEVSLKVVFAVVLALLVGVGIGFAVSVFSGYNESHQSVSEQANTCLTLRDLNRQDMVSVVTLSRFCEGMGFNSAVKWEKDSNGNFYGLPVCLPPQQ